MKGSIFAAAALVGSAMADAHLHRRHDALHQRRAASSSVAETCGCTTKVITYYGSPTMVPIPEPTSTSTSTVHSTSTNTETVTVTPTVAATETSTSTEIQTPTQTPTPTPSTSTVIVHLPTPGMTSFSKTGTYTVPATTLVVTDTTTVCGATSTEVPSGTHTYGGVTTVVQTDTTVTCPYATVKPTGNTVTSVIEYTTYTCPKAGTYTVVPGTVTSVPSRTAIVYPTPSSINPGTYTQPETTITATRTDYTYVCPYSTSLASPTPAPPTTTAAPTTTETPSTTEAPTSTATPSDVAPVSSSTGSPQPSGLTGKGQKGMTFSPYTASGACMSKADVFKGIKLLADKGFDLIRVYSTDCNTLEYVGEACKKLGMEMILGVFIEGSGTSGAQEQVDAITQWAQWDMVNMIVVGNEAISSGYASAPQLASFIKSAKSTFQSAGYTGPVTTTDTIDIWQSYGILYLCNAVDIVGANMHPFFNPLTPASAAGAFVKGEYTILKTLCGKDVINLETGWPSAGSANGLAIPSPADQKTAIHGIAQALGDKSIFFSNTNDEWKEPGPFGVEQFWGCSNVFE